MSDLMTGVNTRSSHTVARVLHLAWSIADRPVRLALILGTVTVLLSSMLTGLAPVALAALIDAVAPDTASSGHWAWTGLIVAYTGCLGTARVFAELRASIYGRALQRLNRSLAERTFAHSLSLPLRYHHSHSLGALSQAVTSGLIGNRMIVYHVGHTLAPLLIETSIVAFVLAQFHSTSLIALFLCTATLYAIAFTRGSRALQAPAHGITSTSIAANCVLTDSIVNYEAVKSFNAEPAMCERYQHILTENECNWTQWYRRRAVLGLIVACIFASSMSLSLIWAARGVERGSLSVGEFALVNAYMLRLAVPLELLGVALKDMSEGAAYVKKLLDILDTDVEPETGRRDVGHRYNGSLELREVSFGYLKDLAVLNNISFSVPAGSTVAIVGPSGSGKSSLAKLLLRLYEPTSGTILLDGKDIADLSLHELRHVIAIVPQDTVLLNDTIAKNIALGAPCDQCDIELAARIAGMESTILSWPEGYATMVGERGLKLSGGERQRIAIARAIVRKPCILIFDEATSSLDAQTERSILRELTQVTRHITTLVIAHRLTTVVHARTILVLVNGQLAEQGSHAELLARGGCYASLWNAQYGVAAPA